MKNSEKTIEATLAVWLFLLPWQTRLVVPGLLNGGYWEYGSVSLYATELLLWFALGLFAVWLWHTDRPKFSWSTLKARLRQPAVQLYWGMAGFFVFALLSTSWSLAPGLSWYSATRLLEAGALVALVVSVPLRLPVLLGSLIASAVVQSALGCWQFFTQSSPAFKWLGLAAHDATIGGSIVLESASEIWLRAYGSLPHPNMLGSFLAFAWLAVVWLSFEYTSRRSRMLLLAALVGITPGLFLSFSRSAWVGLGVANIFLMGWLLGRSTPTQRRTFAGCLGITALIVVVMSVLLAGPLMARLRPHQRLEVNSIQLRLTFNQQARTVIENTLPFGTGVGAYTLGVHRFVNSTWPHWYYQPVHLVPLLVLAELGPLGVLWYLLLIGGLVFALIRQTISLDRCMLLLMFLVVIVTGFFDHYIWTLWFGSMLFWLLFGLNLRELGRPTLRRAAFPSSIPKVAGVTGRLERSERRPPEGQGPYGEANA